MKVVIDTNVMLTLFKKGHANRPIYEAWTAGKLEWAVSTEILLEYEETAARINGPGYASLILRTLTAVGAWRKNVHPISPTYRFHTIPADADDDKFADCAIRRLGGLPPHGGPAFPATHWSRLQAPAHHTGRVHRPASGVK
jgi:uncharacterized protein